MCMQQIRKANCRKPSEQATDGSDGGDDDNKRKKKLHLIYKTLENVI